MILAGMTCVMANWCGGVIVPFVIFNIHLRRALFVPSIGYSLLATSSLAEVGIESHFRRNDSLLKLQMKTKSSDLTTKIWSRNIYVLSLPSFDGESIIPAATENGK